MQLTYSDVAEILKMIDASSCEELILEMGEFRLVVRKFSSHPLPEQSMPLVSSYDLEDGGNVITHDSEKTQSSVSSTADKVANHTDGSIINAPMVGTFYRRPGPDQPTYVEVGSRVKSGDTLCLIEVMKLFTQVESRQAGTVEAVLAEDEQLVEYGQPLFRITS